MGLIPSSLFSAETRILKSTTVSPEARRIIDALARIHGKVHVSQEKNGVHAYLPCPKLLEEDGEKELFSRHLSVNLDKYLGQGPFAGKPRDSKFNLALCMKTKKVYTVSDLLEMDTLAERGLKHVKSHVVITELDNREKLIQDDLGVWVPPGPGTITPLIDMPKDHPAVAYLLDRGYRLDVLHEMFRAEYCHWELPEGQYKRFYRKGPDGWKDTPQGRVIFNCIQDGSAWGWQGRVLEKIHGDWRFFWHPYRQQWVHVHQRVGDAWVLRADYGDHWKQISKYKTADAMSRNGALFGFDAAVRWNQKMASLVPGWKRFAVVTEGPLDAGKFQQPGVCAAGGFVSDLQMALLARSFQFVFGAFDNDEAGRKAADSFMSSQVQIGRSLLQVPGAVKDIGDLNDDDIGRIKKHCFDVLK